VVDGEGGGVCEWEFGGVGWGKVEFIAGWDLIGLG
jgi:hypothetical protein